MMNLDFLHEETTIQLDKRQSYLDIIRDALNKENKVRMAYRVVLIGQFAKDIDRSDYATHYQKLFKKEQSEAELITGILLTFRTSFIHVLEAPKRIIYQFLEDVYANPEKAPDVPMTQNTRILVLMDDISDRYFPFWASRVIEKDEPVKTDLQIMDEKAVDDLISGVCISMFKIGTSLSNLNRSEMKQAFEEISDRYSQYIPSGQLIHDLASFNGIESVEEWIHEFHQGYMPIAMESELVWPAPKTLVI
ncbi:hypothetical protein BC833DRAFT_601771 [Globomyces pollinis-pini]|nr:hypothetical protein BC833DRAFT_601771 [Globomyces pollinis-pini]